VAKKATQAKEKQLVAEESPPKKSAASSKAKTTKAKTKAKVKATKAKPAAKSAKAAPAQTPAKLPKSGKLKSLLVVESPAKARTIKKYLGSAFMVKASVGHVKDLPKSKLGVDPANDFEPSYVVIRSKEKVIEEIREAAKIADKVYLAPDPDREGEAIAFHIADEISDVNTNVVRVLINEITKRGVTEAIAHPTALNGQMYDAQQARRILDRLVGYQISPVLWDKVKRGLSAGRVQSVAVRIVVERDRAIAAFNPVEYWTVEIDCQADAPPPFAARVVKWGDEKAELTHGAIAEEVAAEIRSKDIVVAKVERKERKKNPAAPFITSRLQQEAARKLRFTAKKTMAVAQRLYEGMDLGEEGPVGLITYMRTDSTRLSDQAITEVREYIGARYGADYLPAEPNVYKQAKSAQGAHEAIRPTSMKYDPDMLRKLLIAPLTGLETEGVKGVNVHEKLEDYEDAIRLYTLIWNRFVACQMIPAVYDQTSVDLVAGRAGLRASGQVLKVAGFTRIFLESDEEDASTGEDKVLPPLVEGELVRALSVRPEQHFTQPPPRFTEASLVKELEENGIGRPSTYASILSTVQDRGYVEKREGRFFPTELGTIVNDLLVKAFPDILNVDFTREMEERLDKVEEGADDWVKVLRGFYDPFQVDLARASEEMRDVKREEIPTDFVCEVSGDPMVVKWGRNGSFLACKGYPECKNTKEFLRLPDGSIKILEEKKVDQRCPTCGSEMKIKRGRFGEFVACTKYPECVTTMPISVGVNCPREGCGGYLTAKRSRRNKIFYGCSNYSKTKCDFVTWDLPIPEPCPQCQAPFLVKKELKSGTTIRCIADGCGYSRRQADANEEPEAPEPEAVSP
jgi:DNA topoisomerase I